MLCATLLGAAVVYLAYVRPWRAGVDTLDDGGADSASGDEVHGDRSTKASFCAEPAVLD